MGQGVEKRFPAPEIFSRLPQGAWPRQEPRAHRAAFIRRVVGGDGARGGTAKKEVSGIADSSLSAPQAEKRPVDAGGLSMREAERLYRA